MNWSDAMNENEQTSPGEITLMAKATDTDLAQLRELGRRYGTPYFIEIVRHAMQDALAHFECPLGSQSNSVTPPNR